MNLLQQIEQETDEEKRAHLLMELLRQMRAGRPVTGLIRLLESAQVSNQESASWVISELSSLARPLWSFAARLLLSPSPYVRFNALPFVVNCGTAADGDVIALAIRLLDDPLPPVRKEAMRFLVCADVSHLQAASQWFSDRVRDNSTYHQGMAIVLDESIAAARAVAKSGDPVLRRFAIAKVIRDAMNPMDILDCADESQDPEIISFAEHAVDLRGTASRA